MPATAFPTPPNFHALDWWGQIGKRTDPLTHAPVAGWIYDCNPYGHTIRPYVPPCRTLAHANLHWYGPDANAHLVLYDCTLLLATTDGGTTWVADQTLDGVHTAIYIELAPSAEDAYAWATYEDPIVNAILAVGHNLDTTAAFHLDDTFPLSDVDCNVTVDLRGPLPPTAAQLAQQNRFAAAHAEWLALTDTERRHYDRAAARQHRSGYNRFMALNAKAS